MASSGNIWKYSFSAAVWQDLHGSPFGLKDIVLQTGQSGGSGSGPMLIAMEHCLVFFFGYD